MRSSVIALLFTLSLASIANAGDPEKWWEYSTVYQIYPRSFQDTNNDGVGDLKGIEQRMSHLANFNGGSIWLSPIYQSPMVDFGYDISDFKAIDPIFGTFEDFTSMIEAAHQYGIRVVLDFIPNHSSDQHEWFHKSVMREDPYTDFYVWVDPKGYDNDGNPIPPSNWVS
jgi:glycosidase